MKRPPIEAEEPMELSVAQEIAVLPGIGESISIRAAKAHFSGLLEWVSRGREVVVTSDGTPKVWITPFKSRKRRKVFLGAANHLKKMTAWTGGPPAEEIVRADRDGRDW